MFFGSLKSRHQVIRELEVVVVAGKGLGDLLERGLERTPRERDALDLTVMVGTKTALDDPVLVGAVLTRRVVEEEVVGMVSDIHPVAQHPGGRRELLREYLGTLNLVDAPYAPCVHHRISST